MTSKALALFEEKKCIGLRMGGHCKIKKQDTLFAVASDGHDVNG